MPRRIDPALFLILAIALALRVQGIDDDGYWLDEFTSLRNASQPVSSILLGEMGPTHVPLYYLLLKGWVGLFGTSETAVRMLSAIFGTAAVGAAFLLFRALHGRASGLAAALLLAVSFHHVVFSQEARMYALFGLLALLSAHALWRALEEGGWRRWAACAAFAVLMVYTHHQAWFVLFGEALGAVLAVAVGPVRKGALKGFALAGGAVAVAALPSVLFFILGVGRARAAPLDFGVWQPKVSWQGLVDLAAVWVPGGALGASESPLYGPHPPRAPWIPWLLPGLALPAVFLAIAWLRGPRTGAPSPRPPPILFHLGILCAGLGAYVLAASIRPVWHVRYATVFLPFYVGGIAALLAALRTRPARLAALAVLVGLSLPGLVAEKRRQTRTPWRETAAYMAGRESKAVFMIAPLYLRGALAWYYKGSFEVLPNREALVPAVLAAAEGGGSVLVVYCNAHDPPDPRHLGARELARTLAIRGTARFGPLRVYEFAKRP